MMTKDWFKVVQDDSTQLRYVMKVVDEETKNHKDLYTSYKCNYARNGWKSFVSCGKLLTYTEALSPKSPWLWQTPKSVEFSTDINNNIWCYGKVGRNKIEAFVSDLCVSCGLPKGKYTNHSLRATPITNLKWCHWNDKQVMSISGHKSAASLNIYQKVNADEKLKMGNTLSKCLINEDTNPEEVRQSVEIEFDNLKVLNKSLVKRKMPSLPTSTATKSSTIPSFINPATGTEIPEGPYPKRQMLMPIQKAISEPENQPTFDLTDCDILKLISECEQENEELMLSQEITKSNTTTTRQVVAKKSSPRIPVFNKCQISGNITININKM